MSNVIDTVRDVLDRALCNFPDGGAQVALTVVPELRAQVGMAQNRYHTLDVWAHTCHVVTGVAPVDGDPARTHLRRLAALFHDVGKPIMCKAHPDRSGEFTFLNHDAVGGPLADAVLRRLGYPEDLRTAVVRLVTNHMASFRPDWTDAAVRRYARRVGENLLDDQLALLDADVDPGEQVVSGGALLRARLAAVRAKDAAPKGSTLTVTGADVMGILGCGPGPRVGAVLKALTARVADGTLPNDPDALRAAIPDLIR